MPSDDLIVYYFDGSLGCEICNALTGYTFDAHMRPHEGCDCPMESYRMEEVGDCDLEIRNADYDGLEDEWVHRQTTPVTCLWEEIEVQRTQPTFIESTVSPALRAAAEEEGWSPPDEETLEYDYTIPKLIKEATRELTLTYYYASVTGTWCLVCRVIDANGQELESVLEVGIESGTYSCISDVEVEIVDTDPCIGP